MPSHTLQLLMHGTWAKYGHNGAATINFNTVLGAWAKSNSGKSGAERAEKILEWMDKLRKAGNADRISSLG